MTLDSSGKILSGPFTPAWCRSTWGDYIVTRKGWIYHWSYCARSNGNLTAFGEAIEIAPEASVLSP